MTNLGNQVFLSITSEIRDLFRCLRCLKKRINLLDMIGPFAAGTTDPLVPKNLTKFFVYAFVISIAILWYL